MEINEDHILARKQAIYALRNTPESQRISGRVFSEDFERVCAIGLIARELNIMPSIQITHSVAYVATDDAVENVSKKLGTYSWAAIFKEIISMNDAKKWEKDRCIFKYSWPQIADYLEDNLDA